MTTAVEAFLAHCRDRRLAKTTLANYEAILTSLAGMAEPGASLNAIGRDTVRLWLGRYLTPAGAKTALVVARAFFRWAVGAGVVSADPTGWIPSPRMPKPLPRALAAQDVDKIVECVKVGKSRWLTARDRAVLEVLYGAGLRASELAGLDLDDLEMCDYAHIVRVRHGKGDKERLVPLGERAIEAVRAWIRERCRKSDPISQNALFVSRAGRRITRFQVYQIVRKTGASVGVAAYPHALRHSFATHLLDGGASTRAVQEMMGHASVVTTERYLAVSKGHLIAAYKRAHRRAA